MAHLLGVAASWESSRQSTIFDTDGRPLRCHLSTTVLHVRCIIVGAGPRGNYVNARGAVSMSNEYADTAANMLTRLGLSVWDSTRDLDTDLVLRFVHSDPGSNGSSVSIMAAVGFHA